MHSRLCTSSIFFPSAPLFGGGSWATGWRTWGPFFRGFGRSTWALPLFFFPSSAAATRSLQLDVCGTSTGLFRLSSHDFGMLIGASRNDLGGKIAVPNCDTSFGSSSLEIYIFVCKQGWLASNMCYTNHPCCLALNGCYLQPLLLWMHLARAQDSMDDEPCINCSMVEEEPQPAVVAEDLPESWAGGGQCQVKEVFMFGIFFRKIKHAAAVM